MRSSAILVNTSRAPIVDQAALVQVDVPHVLTGRQHGDDDVRAVHRVGGTASDVAARLGLKFPVLLDTDKAVSHLYDLSTMPSTVLVDRDGKVRYVHRGYLTGVEADYDKQIRELLK